MGKLCDTMVEASKDFWHAYFPEQIDIPECVLELLKFIYPTVNWDNVAFYDGIPYYVNTGQNAITLPDQFVPWKINVFFGSGQWDPCTEAGLARIVHEGFHVLQMQDMLGGWGLGFVRPFIIQYLSCWAGNGFSYEEHPMEQAAYFVAGCASSSPPKCPQVSLFNACYDSSLPICDCSSGSPVLNQTNLNTFKQNCANVVQNSSGSSFWAAMAECVPGLEYLLKAGTWLSDTFCRPFKNLNSTEWAQDISLGVLRKLCKARKETEVGPEPTVPGRTGDMQPPEPLPREGRKINWWMIFCILGLVVAGITWIVWGLWWLVRLIICGFGWLLRGILYVIYGIYYAVWMIVWTAVNIVVWVVKVFWEIIGIIIDGILWIITGILCALEWIWEQLVKLWNWFKGVVAGICDWAVEVEQECAEWEQTWTQTCADWEDEGYETCDEYEDHGYETCDDYEDHGYETCDDWEETCTDWLPWPLSYLCDVVEWVCVSYVWVSNWVCVAWVWVSNWVCVAWVWVSSWVCKAWVWIVSKTCKAFTWVVKGVTCWAKD